MADIATFTLPIPGFAFITSTIKIKLTTKNGKIYVYNSAFCINNTFIQSAIRIEHASYEIVTKSGASWKIATFTFPSPYLGSHNTLIKSSICIYNTFPIWPVRIEHVYYKTISECVSLCECSPFTDGWLYMSIKDEDMGCNWHVRQTIPGRNKISSPTITKIPSYNQFYWLF